MSMQKTAQKWERLIKGMKPEWAYVMVIEIEPEYISVMVTDELMSTHTERIAQVDILLALLERVEKLESKIDE